MKEKVYLTSIQDVMDGIREVFKDIRQPFSNLFMKIFMKMMRSCRRGSGSHLADDSSSLTAYILLHNVIKNRSFISNVFFFEYEMKVMK